MEVRGYKVFNPDWTCRKKQYTCPGIFEENVIPSVCEEGMHFCKKAADCFNYYKFDTQNHVAEVVANGDVAENGDKCSTNKLEIVREIPWAELLELVNVGSNCTGINNAGDYNTGDRNTGNYNIGSWNVGNRNTGNYNTGYYNSGDRNNGNYNSGDWNTGNYNSGDCNTGDYNVGNWNTGNWNTGYCNTGGRNTGNYNTGRWNTGHYNTGNWNKTNHSSGMFNTKEQPITMFDLPTEWSYSDWEQSEACMILNKIPHNTAVWVWSECMTEEEKTAHPEYKTVGGYLKETDLCDNAAIWWRGLTDKEREVVMSLPNFDKEIFKEITGIDVDNDQIC